MRNSHLVFATVALFSVSSALLATSFSLTPAIVTLVAVLASNAIVAHNAPGELLSRSIDWGWLAVCLSIGVLLAMLGGEGHFFYAKDDWLGRGAVLADIVDRWMPVIYLFEGKDSLLRAPLGMYLSPGALGRLLGLRAAHLALLAQNSVILGVFFYITTLVWPRRRILFIILFVLFSGLDAIPVLIKTGGASLLRYLAFWVEIGNYPANVNQLFWAPNHALPGWWFAALGVLYLRREIDLASLAAASVPLILWSPLSMMGAIPIFALIAILAPREQWSPRLALACAAALCFFPILAYLRADAEAVPHDWQIFEQDFLGSYSIFILFALTQIGFLAFFWRRVAPWFRTTLWASVALLLMFPLYNLGFMNDFTQRVSIVARTFLAFGFDALLIDLLAANNFVALAPGALIVLTGAITPALEFYDTFTTPRFSISNCNLLTVYAKHNHDRYFSTYLARVEAAPTWLFPARDDRAPLQRETRDCWPDRVHGEKLFNWLKPENRVWLRKPDARERPDAAAL